MTDYKRFVAYLYEYENGQKGVNRGVVRVESRNQICTITLQIKCPNLPQGTPVSLYGFIRNNQALKGLPIGEVTSGNGGVYGKLQTSADHIGNSDYGLHQLGGLILLTPQHRFFGTQWDDRPIHPENFSPDIHEDLSSPSDSPSEETITAPSPEKEVHITSAEPLPTPELPIFLSQFPPIEPFADEEITNCIRLNLEDIPECNHHGFSISVNQFLLHGMNNYHHILVGYQKKTQSYILGIPGCFDIHEQFMASLFGYTAFKEASCPDSHTIPQFGYWYRPLAV